MSAPLRVSNLSVDYFTRRGSTRAVDGVNLELGPIDSVGLVGESGSGKTTVALAIGGLLPANASVDGDVEVAGSSMVKGPAKLIRSLRRDYLGFVFQSPVAALDPTRRVHRLLADLGIEGSRAVEILSQVGLDGSKQILNSYPHQLSGGMAQRVAVAIAIARHPKLVVADEPTASLDSSVRNQILALIFGLRTSIGASILMLSHDLQSIGRYCNRIAVMYGGRIVEEGLTTRVVEHPAHPYTAALLAAVPGTEGLGGRLEAIPGSSPRLTARSRACAFVARCPYRIEVCARERPEPTDLPDQRAVCFRAGHLSLAGRHVSGVR